MEKSCVRKEGHPPRQLLKEQLHGEKVETFAQHNSAQSLIHPDRVDPAGRAKVFIWRRPGWKGDPSFEKESPS